MIKTAYVYIYICGPSGTRVDVIFVIFSAMSENCDQQMSRLLHHPGICYG